MDNEFINTLLKEKGRILSRNQTLEYEIKRNNGRLNMISDVLDSYGYHQNREEITVSDMGFRTETLSRIIDSGIIGEITLKELLSGPPDPLFGIDLSVVNKIYGVGITKLMDFRNILIGNEIPFEDYVQPD